MKFGKRMAEEMIPAWREFYVSYKRLKQFVRQSELTKEAFNDELFRVLREELGRAEKHFFNMLEELSAAHDVLVARKHETDVELGTPLGMGSNHSAAQLDSDSQIPKSSLLIASSLKRHSSTNRRQNAAPDETEEIEVIPESGYPHLQEVDYTATPKLPPGFWTSLKKLFLSGIGDKGREEVKREGQTMKTDFIEWFTEARRLIRFAELNIEAVHKTLKKLRKSRADEGDFTHSVEMELSMSSLTSLLPKLHGMVDDIKEVFHTKFNNENLEQYENVTMATREVWHAKWLYVGISFLLFAMVMTMPVVKEVHGPAHRCLALFVLVISMWVTEAIPFFCTAMLIPLIAVPLAILQDPSTGAVADPVVAARIILSRVFDHVQILVLGGLTMAKAMSKTHLEITITAKLHRLTAHRPKMYMLGVMVMGCSLCAFVSNVAAPLLVLSVIQQTLWEFPVEAPEAPKAILLGLAFSCNLGGMLSPIASPQNAVAMQTVVLHHFSFASWIAVALPIVAIALIVAWIALLTIFKPFKNVKYIPHQVVSSVRKPMKKEVFLVSIVCAVTVLLWCLPPSLFFGDTGIIALIPIVVFFGVGVLKKEDFNSLPWHLMFLLAGGNMLGQCARDSKLLDLVSDHLRRELVHCTPYQILIIVAVGVGILTTFISHTVAAMILLPVIATLGAYFPAHHAAPGEILSWAVTPEALVFCSVLMCSGAMAFPISSFPNVNSLLAEDEVGTPYLKARDFLAPGFFMTTLCLILLVTLIPPVVNLVLMYSSILSKSMPF